MINDDGWQWESFCDGKRCRKREKKSDHVTCDCVSELNLNSEINNITDTYRVPKHMPRTSETPFSSPITRKDVKSSNPKTILNRSYAFAKRGLEISNFRDDGAYRSKKYRALKKLRTSDGWVNMSPDEQQDAEEKIVRKLEEERDAKKRAHERQWIQKVESNEVKSDEDDIVSMTETDHDEEGEQGRDGDAENGWITDDPEDEGGDKEKSDLNHLKSELHDIRKKSSEAFVMKLKHLERKAKEKERLLFSDL